MPNTLELFGTLLHGDTPHSQFTHSYISSYIPKPGKDPSIPDNCRPIALLNSDYKIFTKILSSTLSQFISKLVNGDQVGFVPSRHAMDNTRRTIDLFDFLNKFPHPGIAQKVFDRLSWLYMFSTLSPFGFKGPFLKALQALYFLTSAKVQVASFLSPWFPMSNGTRQWCTLSPFFFSSVWSLWQKQSEVTLILRVYWWDSERTSCPSLLMTFFWHWLTLPSHSLPDMPFYIPLGPFQAIKLTPLKLKPSPYAYHQML